MKRLRPKRILFRIILPFTSLFALTTLLSWIFSSYLISRYIEQNLKKQMTQVADVISNSGYVLNPAILRQMKDIIAADIVFSDRTGRIVSTTFADARSRDTFETLFGKYLEDASSDRDMLIREEDYRILIHPLVLPDRGPGYLALQMSQQDAEYLKTRIVFGTGGMALLGILAMAGIGYLIARTITAPVEDLVRVTGRVSSGDFSHRARPQGEDEISTLAESFNHMIDQLRAFEMKLVETEKLAAAGQMAAGLAHEIRNPLTSVRMMGQVLHNRLKDQPESQGVLMSMVKEIDRLDRIIKQMIHRTSPGELQRAWGDINKQVEDVIGVAKDNLAAKEIDVKLDLSNDLPELFMDEEKVKQVLWNLILNAQESMPKGGHLKISTGMLHDQFVRISVEDSGRGVAPGDMEHLYQAFFTTKPEGMGLGLTMSRKIVEKHEGSLSLENREEGGARAEVRLPIGKEQTSSKDR